MKTFATILTASGIVLAGLQWWQIVYRVSLFYRDYGSQRYSNHVGDDTFVLIHVVNLVLLLAGVFAAWTLRRDTSAWRWLVVGITATNAIAWLAFIYMHSTGVLVEYSEFIRHMRGE